MVSKSEAKRLIEQGAVEIDGVKVTNRLVPAYMLKDGSTVRIGKHVWIKIRNSDEHN